MSKSFFSILLTTVTGEVRAGRTFETKTAAIRQARVFARGPSAFECRVMRGGPGGEEVARFSKDRA